MRSSLFLFLLLLVACVPDMKERGYDTKKLSEDIKNRKIKKLTPTQINTWVYENGLKIVKILNEELAKLTETERQEKKIALQSLDSLQKAYKIHIQLVDLTQETLPSLYTGKAKEVIEACIYQFKNGLSIQPNLQKLENQNFLFIASAESMPQHIWQIDFSKVEVIKQIDQKEFNP